MTTLRELAQSIKKRRSLLKITQEDLAQIASVSLRSLKGIETGKANPTWNQMVKVFEALGWEVELKEKAG
jgi:predicted transcriptional regulator